MTHSVTNYGLQVLSSFLFYDPRVTPYSLSLSLSAASSRLYNDVLHSLHLTSKEGMTDEVAVCISAGQDSRTHIQKTFHKTLSVL